MRPYPIIFLTTLLSVLSSSTAAPFCLTSLCSHNCTHEVQNAIIHASGQAFWIGLKGPATYCPQPPVTCSLYPGNETLVAMAIPGQLSLWDLVPGGQRIYVATDGTIAFTQAHSAFIPSGSYIAGFTNVTTTPSCYPPSATILGWSTPGDSALTGILACLVPAGHFIQPAKYKLYARTPEFNQTGCVELTGLLEHVKPTSAFNAWQYT